MQISMLNKERCEIIRSKQSIIEYVPEFLKSIDINKSSKRTYSDHLKLFFRWLMKNKIDIPTRGNILEYKEYLSSKKKPNTISLTINVLSIFFKYLARIKVYTNITADVKRPKRPKGFLKSSLSKDYVKLLLGSIDCNTLQGKRDYVIINLMIRTGLRLMEIVCANREDIMHHASDTVLFIQGKGHNSKDEFILLTDATLRPIKEYFNMRGLVRDAHPIFVSHSTRNPGDRLTTRSISRIVKNRLKAININDPRFTAHSMRHTAITFSLLSGATLQETQVFARHANINTTLIYSHNIDRIKNAAERKIDALLYE